MPTLTRNAFTFSNRLSKLTGLNKFVIYGWVTAETSGWDTTNGPNNWLNVGSFDSGFVGGGANVWNNPKTAADATAAFMFGHPVNGISSPVGNSSQSIHGILNTAGSSISDQVAAIQGSDWASGHYGWNLAQFVEPFVGHKITVTASAPSSAYSLTRPGGNPSGGGGGSDYIENYFTRFTADSDTTVDPSTEYTGFWSTVGGIAQLGSPLTDVFSHIFSNINSIGKAWSTASTLANTGVATVEDLYKVTVFILNPFNWLRLAEFFAGGFIMWQGIKMSLAASRSGRIFRNAARSTTRPARSTTKNVVENVVKNTTRVVK